MPDWEPTLEDLVAGDDEDGEEMEGGSSDDDDDEDEDEEMDIGSFPLHDLIDTCDVDGLTKMLSVPPKGEKKPKKEKAEGEDGQDGEEEEQEEEDEEEEDEGEPMPLYAKLGIRLDKRDRSGVTALHLAVKQGFVAGAALLIEAGADILHPLSGSPLLHIALARGGLASSPEEPALANEMVNMLLEHGCSPDGVDDYKRTPAHIAAWSGLEQPLKTLLSQCRDKNAQDMYGSTALHAAAALGRCNIVKIFLAEEGVDATIADGDGCTPLHKACAFGCADCARALVAKAPAALTAVNAAGVTPAQVAANMGHAAVCEALGAPAPVVPAPEGKTLLLLPKSCEDHKTAPSLARDADDVPPENVDRLRVLTDSQTGILQLGEFADRTVQEDCERPAAMVDVLRVHEYTYIKKIQTAILTAGLGEDEVGTLDGDTAFSRGTWQAALVAAGTACEAVDRVVEGKARNVFCAVRPPGHHAGPLGPVSPDLPPGQGSHGFCLINNVALAAAYARCVHRDRIKRVAIIDFDVHHGNGTEAICEAVVPTTYKLPFSTAIGEGVLKLPLFKPWLNPQTDPQNIFFASVHGFEKEMYGSFYPGTGATVDTRRRGRPLDFTETQEWVREGVVESPGAFEEHPRNSSTVIDVGMHGVGPMAARGAAWRRVWTGRVLPALAQFKPDLLFISAGFDAHAKDGIQGPVNLGVREADYEWLTGELVKIANSSCNGRIVSVLEGGYSIQGGIVSAFARSVAAHVRALAQPTAEGYDSTKEQERLREFWRVRRERMEQEAREQREREQAAIAAAAASGELDAAQAAAAMAAVADSLPESLTESGRKRRRAEAVDYAALAAKLEAEEAALKGGAGAAAPMDDA